MSLFFYYSGKSYRIHSVTMKANDFTRVAWDIPSDQAVRPLKADGHYLTTIDNADFFLLADTGWLMLYQLSLGDMEFYLKRRKAQGFNTILAMLLSSRNERTDNGIPANRNGEFPFRNRCSGNGWNGDPSLPDQNFWKFVDQAVELANSLGMYLCLLPVWGHAVTPQAPEWANESNLIFPTDQDGIQRARNYCNGLGNRFKQYPNIIWMLGGDRRAMGDGYDARPVWDAMAAGLLDARKDYLITFHPQGGPERTSTWFRDRPWLSMNSFQSGHGKNRPQFATEDWKLIPVKPSFDAEACYENITHENQLITAHDVRKAAYQSVFSGACGHVYGELNVFQFYDNENPWFHATQNWRTAMEAEGANQMGFLRRLMEWFPRHRPDHSIIYSGTQNLENHSDSLDEYRNAACRGEDWALIYISGFPPENPKTPLAQSVVLNLSGRGNRLSASWINPRSGEFTAVGIFDNKGYHVMVPPETGPTQDWILVVQTIE